MTSQQTEHRFDEYARRRELFAAMTDDQLRLQITNAYHEYRGQILNDRNASDRTLTLLWEACEQSDRQQLWHDALADYKARRTTITRQANPA